VKSLFIDSDVFIRDLRYPRDEKTDFNKSLLEKIRKRKFKAVTSYFNLLEICGILSFNLSSENLLRLYADFIREYRVKILFPSDASGFFQYDYAGIFDQIRKKQSLGDAQASYIAERFRDGLSAFVSWNARHFEGKLSVPVMTPEQILAEK
jgi:hypothetical protein